ncbi:MAG: hypothetical protein HY849_01030 [Nitrosomonadales bacterium]|nr:hypothetical protein [Nitrosomonadales bacterium]
MRLFPSFPNNPAYRGEMHAEVIGDLQVRVTSCRMCHNDGYAVEGAGDACDSMGAELAGPLATNGAGGLLKSENTVTH